VPPINTDPSIPLDSPLLQLLGKPLHEMTPDEVRQHVARLQELRKSPQTFTAALKQESETLKEKVGGKTRVAKVTKPPVDIDKWI
jgi:hypothetical protein